MTETITIEKEVWESTLRVSMERAAKLEMAIKCLEEYANCENWYNIYDDESASFKPLYRHRKWKDDFGYKLAQKTLKELGYVKKA